MIWYITALAAAFAVSAALTKAELPALKRLKAGQSIREEGPQSHMSKAGTPTMGGMSIIAAACIASLAIMRSTDMWVIAGSTAAFGLVGFADDFRKVVRRHNLGLRAWQKMALLSVFAILLAVYGYVRGAQLSLPFSGGRTLDIGLWYIPLAAFAVLAMTNAVNLTDGLDGLAGSVTAIAAACMGAINLGASGIFAFSLSGACLGFLLFNRHPAKVFMGDTGSLALGGALAAVGICSENLLALPVCGGIYVAEAVSVIIQVFVFKTQNGRRFFRMAPLHHHFEMGGMKETQVVARFAAVTALLSLAAYFMFGK